MKIEECKLNIQPLKDDMAAKRRKKYKNKISSWGHG
jgi:hypothetical protein